MTVRTYASTDVSAPALTGQSGSLSDLLHAILVTGYGAKAAAGWTRDFYSDADKTAVFRPGAGPRHYWWIDDGGPGAGTFKEARARGYVTMSAWNAGTEPFPTVAQAANGLFIRKSASLDAVQRNWLAFADEATVYLFVESDPGTTGYIPYWFGAFASWKANDAYASFIAGRIVENTNSITTTQMLHHQVEGSNPSYNFAYAPRSFSGVGSSVGLSQNSHPLLARHYGAARLIGSSGAPYPNPADGGLLLSPIFLTESFNVRGQHRGFWDICHAKPVVHGDTWSAVDGPTTRDYAAVNILLAGQCAMETSSTWDL